MIDIVTMITSIIALILFCVIGNGYALPSNFVCNTRYPPEYFKKYYPVSSIWAGRAWNVTCKTWSDSTGNLDFTPDPLLLHARLFTQFRNGGLFSQFFTLNGTHETYSGNITTRATPADGQFSPMSLCVEQTPIDFSSQTFMNTVLEIGANMYTDQYINKFDTTAPAFYASQQEFFVTSKNKRRFFSQLTRWDPATAKTTYMLTCVYKRAESIPESVGNWWE